MDVVVLGFWAGRAEVLQVVDSEPQALVCGVLRQLDNSAFFTKMIVNIDININMTSQCPQTITRL